MWEIGKRLGNCFRTTCQWYLDLGEAALTDILGAPFHLERPGVQRSDGTREPRPGVEFVAEAGAGPGRILELITTWLVGHGLTPITCPALISVFLDGNCFTDELAREERNPATELDDLQRLVAFGGKFKVGHFMVMGFGDSVCWRRWG